MKTEETPGLTTLDWTYSRNQRRHTAYDKQGQERFMIVSNSPDSSVQGSWGYSLRNRFGDIIRHGCKRVSTLKRQAEEIMRETERAHGSAGRKTVKMRTKAREVYSAFVLHENGTWEQPSVSVPAGTSESCIEQLIFAECGGFMVCGLQEDDDAPEDCIRHL